MKYPLSSAQSQLLAGQLLNVDVPMCNMALAYTIRGELDPELMTNAWDRVAEQSDALRMRLHIEEERILQSTNHAWPVIELLDYSQSTDSEGDADRWMQSAVSTAISPSDVLGQVALIKISESHWIFFCNLHHVICDASSFSSLWEQLILTYQSLKPMGSIHSSVNKSAQGFFKDPSNHFLKHVEDIEQARASRESDLPGYLTHLIEAEAPSPFGQRPNRMSTASTRLSTSFTAERAIAFKQLTAHPKIRGFSAGIGHCHILLSLLVILLHRIGGGSHQTIGLPLPQRQRSEFKKTLGLFVEVLPVQIEVNEQDSFDTVIQRVRASFLNVLKSSAAGDSFWAGKYEIPAVLNYINDSMGDFGELPATSEWLHSGQIDSQHRVRLQVQDWNNSGDLTLAFDFNDAIFNEAQREQTIVAFWHLFDAMATNLLQSVGEVAIVPSRTLASAPVKSNALVSNTVIAQVLRTIEVGDKKTALTQDKTTISYNELGRRVMALADQLKRVGVLRGSRVVVHLHRDIRLPQILLAIHACGAAYVPVDANQPADRVTSIIKSASPSTIISSNDIAIDNRIPSQLDVDDLFAAPLLPSDPNAWNVFVNSVCVEPTDMAYLMFTSGSTGVPKGVCISHASLANYCFFAAQRYGDDQAVNMPLFTPVGFDLTVTSIFLPMLTTGTLHVYDERQWPAVAALGAVIEDDSVNTVKLTPAHLTLLDKESCQKNQHIKQLIVGGEDLTTGQAARVNSLFNRQISILNEYGPTEATVGCVVHRYDPEQDRQGSVPIGKPVAGTRLRVLNSCGQDQLPGCLGELYIGGPSLANGYWDRSDLTDAVFVNLAPNDERYYRTGDVVREDNQGNLTYLRRSNEQFKVRGYRIEPAEIESAALQYPALSSCIAVLVNPQTSAQASDRKCVRCGLSSRVPDAQLNAEGLCSPCQNYDHYKDRVTSYFRPMQEFFDIVESIKKNRQSPYDCIMLLSGGKDSSYALGQLVDMGLSVLAFTLDNGFISQGAKDNIARLCNDLQVDHRYASTPSMNDIFLDSLQRHANVCNGCFKTIYNHALQYADEMNINCIITGLSRGQFFETRLSEDWFTKPNFDVSEMDEAIVAARKVYHRMPDAVSSSMDTSFLNDDDLFNRIQVIDFYRYCNVDLSEMYEYLDSKLPWVRPNDTGRSTNCLINDAGIYVHQYERGFHNYANPYSWDVRLGHKQRDEALYELSDEIDEATVLKQLDDIGYRLSDKKTGQIALYYVSDGSFSKSDLKRWLLSQLPEWMVPVWLIELPALPISLNGKVDQLRLPVPVESPVVFSKTGVPRGFVDGFATDSDEPDKLSPKTDIEKLVARIWSRHLRIEHIGVEESFFQLGGDSLMAIRIVSELNRAGYTCKPADIFEYPTVAQLAQRASKNIDIDANPLSPEELTLPDSVGKKAFSALSESQYDALAKTLAKRSDR